MSVLFLVLMTLLMMCAMAFVLSGKAEAAYTNGKQTVRIQAHRGYSGHFPENTLIAYEKAIEAGTDQIELDVHLSKDGTVFVMHDADVSRTTNGQGDIADLTDAQIKALDAGGWLDPAFMGVRVPTLQEVLDCLQGRIRVNIELKIGKKPTELWQKTVEATAQVVNDHHMWEDCIFSSFSLTAIAWTKRQYPQAFVGLLDWKIESTEDRQLRVLEIGGKGWFGHPLMATPERVALAHERGLIVISAAGNDESTRVQSVQAHLDAGVDYISTNYTREVIDVLVAKGFYKVD